MTERKAILIVDDDEEYRNALRRMLRKSGHDVATAADGLEALQLLSRASFNLIFSETVTSNLNGIELMEEIKRRRIAVHIIFLTAHAEWESYLEVMKIASFDYIDKPGTEQEILSAVKRVPEICLR